MSKKKNVPFGTWLIMYGDKPDFVAPNHKNKFPKAHELLGRMYCGE
jgi:hypothetical protein